LIRMLPEEIARAILDAHRDGVETVSCIHHLRIEPQLMYSGLMAKGAYRGWKRAKHRGRRKVGCFDFKIFVLDDDRASPLVHQRVISDAIRCLDVRTIESVFDGHDPLEMQLTPERAKVAQEVQLAMLEQEVNWGDESFQSWTLFPPSKGRRPRDFIMAYLRRCMEDPGFLGGASRMIAASGSRGVLPPPKAQPEWSKYIEPTTSRRRPWLAGSLLKQFIEAAESMPDNPYYADAYGGRDADDE